MTYIIIKYDFNVRGRINKTAEESFCQITSILHGAITKKLSNKERPLVSFLVSFVVGVDNATKLIKDGQQIRVNGTEGYVEIL